MRTWTFSLLYCVTAACSGDSIDLNDFESAVLDAACSNAVTCGSMPDVATCRAALNTSKDLLTIIAKAKTGAITYNSDKAGECVDMIESRTCAFDGFHTTSRSPCLDVFAGKVAAAGACVIDSECVTGHYCGQTDPQCDTDTSCCAGTCLAIPADVPIGGDCSAAPCVDGAYCDSMDRCATPIAAEGTACDGFTACANPMYCNVFSQAPTCERPAGRGATCDPDKLIPCADNRDYCDATSMKCTQVSAVNGTCGTQGPGCVSYATCTNSVCVADPKAGESCMYDAQNQSDNCLGNLTCSANGSPCTLPAAATPCPRELTSTVDAPAAPKVANARAALRAHEEKARARLGGATWMPQLRD